MSVRKICAALGATAVVAAGLASASLAPADADPSTTPTATDYVGVGSDTTQFVIGDLINGRDVDGTHQAGYNERQASGSPKLASFDACTVPDGKLYPCTPSTAAAPETVTLRQGSSAIPRPNGSGAGRALLYGSTDNPDVTFARSSGGLSANDVNAGLTAYPFAVDTLVMVTAPNTNAPAQLTPQQVLDIYTGKVTNWSEVGGKDGKINPLQPQSGSGTLSFFQAQLTSINGGTKPTDIGKDNEYVDSDNKPCDPQTATTACTSTSVQEHDPTLLTHDPNAIAPFSLGRANLAGPAAVTPVKGFSARRALYDVLRSRDSGNTAPDNPSWFAGTDAMNAIFGKSGFLCSPDARSIIEADGFKQLQSADDGGSCGLPITSTSAPDLTVYDAAGVSSKITATATGGDFGSAHSVAVKVTGAGGTPTGNVTVTVNKVAYTATLDSTGNVTVDLPKDLPAGTYDAAVVYAGDDNFLESTADVPLTVNKVRSAVAANVTSGKYGVSHPMTVKVTGTGTPSGTVSVKVGSYSTVATLSNGTAALTLPASLGAGSYHGSVIYNGDANNNPSSAVAPFTIAKASSTTFTRFPKRPQGKFFTGQVSVTTNPKVASSGTVFVKTGRTVLAKVGIHNGKATVKVPVSKLKKGQNALVASYGGTSNIAGSSRNFNLKK